MQDTQVPKETQQANHTKEDRSSIEKSQSWASFWRFMKTHTGDAVAYSLLAAGLVICFFETFVGGMLVGFITGLYFSHTFISAFQHFQELLLKEGIFRGFIIVISLAAGVISAPGLILGAILGAVMRPLLKGALTDTTGEEKEEKKKK